ncbi:MAG: META domain-containing protein [Actinomycetes bacterium]
MRATHLLRTAAVACAAALALTACGGSADPSIGDEDAGAGGAGGGIEQSAFDTWVLVEGVDVPADTRIDLVLAREDDGSISAGGTAACNSYGGTVELGDGTFAFVDGIAVTEMACEDPALMDAEATYLGLLQGVDTWALESPRLVLTGPDVRLVYEPAAMIGGLDSVSSAVCVAGTPPEECDDVILCDAATGECDSAADCEATATCDDTVSSDDPMPDPVIVVAPDAGGREIVEVDPTVVDPMPLFVQGAAVDGAELLLFVSVGNPACVGVAPVEVAETDTEVVVTVSMGARAGTEGQACTMEAYEVAVPVTLAAPLGDRVLLDGSRTG